MECPLCQFLDWVMSWDDSQPPKEWYTASDSAQHRKDCVNKDQDLTS